MAVHLRANFPDTFLDALAYIDAVYYQSKDLDETNAPWKKLFSFKKSTKPFENVTGVAGFPTIGTVAEGANVPLYNTAQLYDKRFLHTKYAGAWQVSEEMEDDDQWEIVAGMARAFARAFRFTREVNFADVINDAQNGETSADGSNWAASHTLYNGSTVNNSTSTDFGVSAAQTVFNHFATLVDDRGLRIKLSPKFIVANPAMRWVIGEVMGSKLKPYTTDNEKNVLNEENLTEIYWAEVSDTDSWAVFVDPSDMNGFGLRAYDRQQFTVSTEPLLTNLTMISVGRGRWSRGVVDWRAGYHSAGA